MLSPRRNTLATARVSAFLIALILIGCSAKNQVNSNLTGQMPPKFIWAWERSEDLTFLNPKEFGVAYLSQTILLENAKVLPKPRHQQLEMAEGTYIIAVTRIETNKQEGKRPTFSPDMVKTVGMLINASMGGPLVKAVQIDFDAAASEREFYRQVILEVRKQIPEGTPVTMTSLASWCTGDAWFNDFPVDEAVPMAFQMGADEDRIKTYLKSGNDWREPLCRGSYGVSLDDPLGIPLKSGRRVYYFSNNAWKAEDLKRMNY